MARREVLNASVRFVTETGVDVLSDRTFPAGGRQPRRRWWRCTSS